MAATHETRKSVGGVRQWTSAGVRLLASLKLAVGLLVLLSAVLACATLLEAARGREYAQWYVYSSRWFIGLLGLLAANITAAAAVRFPWRRSQFGFVVAHAGLLMLLAGAIQTFVTGVEGQLILEEGATSDEIMLTDRSQFQLLTQRENDVQSTEFSFSPGPGDWRTGEQVDFGSVDGVGLKVLKFYRHAQPRTEWVADPTGAGSPAIEVAVSDAQHPQAISEWYVANPFGHGAAAGRPGVSFQRAAAQSMLADFLKPPALAPGSLGVLSVHYNGQVISIPVDGNVGKKLPVADSGLMLEIVDYYAESVVDGPGKFRSVGDAPKNPMLLLRVHSPGSAQPVSEIAYATNPFLTYEAMKNQKGPAQFWYHHPAVKPGLGTELLQLPDGKLYCRVGAAKSYRMVGEVKQGSRISTSSKQSISIVRHLPHAREESAFSGIELAPGQTSDLEAAALVELKLSGETQQFWLRRNDTQLGVRRIESAKGPMYLMFGYERRPLGFSVKLVDFRRGTNPGGMGDASFSSRVELSGVSPGVSVEREISMNRPLEYGQFTVYQSGFRVLPGGREVSQFSVANAPGRLLKYSGSAMICAGIFFMYYLRLPRRRSLPPSSLASGADQIEPEETEVTEDRPRHSSVGSVASCSKSYLRRLGNLACTHACLGCNVCSDSYC